MTKSDGEMLLARIRQIMAKTQEPFGPAVNIYIKEKYGDKSEGHSD